MDPDPHMAHPARSRSDRGATLTEVLVTIVLLALVIVPVISAVSIAITASSSSRAAANVETALVNAADRVNRAPQRCDYTIYAQAAVQTQGWPPSSAHVQHSYYVPGPSPDVAGTWQTGSDACAGPAPTDLLVQRMTITVTSPDGRVSRTIEVVKSDI